MAFKKKSKLADWQAKAKEGGLCHKCNRNVPVLTVDHIVPVSILDMLDITGQVKYELEENFQFLCSPCNKFKAGRLDMSYRKTKDILLKLLEDY